MIDLLSYQFFLGIIVGGLLVSAIYPIIFKKKRDIELSNFFSKVEIEVQKYVEEKSIDILIDKKSIFIGKSSFDVTKEILYLINDMKKFNLDKKNLIFTIDKIIKNER